MADKIRKKTLVRGDGRWKRNKAGGRIYSPWYAGCRFSQTAAYGHVAMGVSQAESLTIL